MVEGRQEAMDILKSLKERDENRIKAGTHKWVNVPNGKILMKIN